MCLITHAGDTYEHLYDCAGPGPGVALLTLSKHSRRTFERNMHAVLDSRARYERPENGRATPLGSSLGYEKNETAPAHAPRASRGMMSHILDIWSDRYGFTWSPTIRDMNRQNPAITTELIPGPKFGDADRTPDGHGRLELTKFRNPKLVAIAPPYSA